MALRHAHRRSHASLDLWPRRLRHHTRLRRTLILRLRLDASLLLSSQHLLLRRIAGRACFDALRLSLLPLSSHLLLGGPSLLL